MIPKFRVFLKDTKKIADVKSIYFEIGIVMLSNDNLYQFEDIILMQSTGVNDKYGVEIFEGDLIHYTYEGFDWYVPVVYRQGRFEVYHGTLSTIPVSEIPSGEYATNIGNSIRMYKAEFTDIHVAGSIYVNPELLEVT